ncbi:cell surface protein [Chitinispirillum alkaliphilum]|nr:cell surface protein [Chitinispirillum alkaliphilum]
MSLILFLSALILLPVITNATEVIRVPEHFSSIQEAIDHANTGDTVFVGEGVYRESVTLRESIHLLGASPELSIIRGNIVNPVVRGANGATLRNFTIENGNVGILAENISMVIEYCTIRDNKGSGIQCIISLPDIRNNLIYRNEWSGIFCESVRAHRNAIENNVIAENGYSGVMLSGSTEILIRNNQFSKNKQYGIWASEQSRRSRIITNNFFDNRTSHNTFARLDNSNISETPQFSLGKDEVPGFWSSETAFHNPVAANGTQIGIIRPE